MKKIFIPVFMFLVALAIALPTYTSLFSKTYSVPAGSALAKARCVTCHTTGAKLNPYGQDLKKQGKFTEAALKGVEKLDSDGDGKTNKEEILAGSLPGVKGK